MLTCDIHGLYQNLSSWALSIVKSNAISDPFDYIGIQMNIHQDRTVII